MKDKGRKSDAVALTAGARFSAPKWTVGSAQPSPRPSPTAFESNRGRVAETPPVLPIALRPRTGRNDQAPVDAWRPRTVKNRVARRTVTAILGAALVGGGAYAATAWIVSLNAGSSAESQAASVQNLTVTAVSSPAATNLLYPGGTGDVVLTISNPNPYPVTVTGVDLPTNTTYAGGFTSAALTTAQAGCLTGTPSDVIWNFSTSSLGSVHSFTTALTVGASGNANNPLTVTLTNDASMTAAAPAACASTFFSMPSLTGIVATGGAASVTTSPVVDAWTS